ncbi:hypothetical protein B0A48_12525 [Cryoendolithus antarcticus]|uniref:DH domain-containing protein n=1 Tax=Cryoendolithus antarcticus TaxID=1507870 RepID=A0A1V8ST22_9PEZI|nr:hypothetical protein B0A48_12525 [Cryoendolithus antarcticus]
MADVLPLPFGSRLHDLFAPQNTTYLTTYPTSHSGSSPGHAHHQHPRKSTSSSQSSASYLSPRLQPRNVSVSPGSHRSSLLGGLPNPKLTGVVSLHGVSLQVSCDASFMSAPSRRQRSDSESMSSVVHNKGLRASFPGLVGRETSEGSGLDTEEMQPGDVTTGTATQTDYDLPELSSSEPASPSKSAKPFGRWLSTLRRRKMKAQSPTPVTRSTQRWIMDDFEPAPPVSQQRASHKKSDSTTSSFNFVAGIKSATITLASMSIAPLSRRTNKWHRGHNRRSSIVSGSDVRPSAETQRSALDEAAKMRSRKRREKLEELIRTEENYVADVKALSNAYFTILGHHQTLTSFARASAQRTINDILHIHDELLGNLYSVVPSAEYDQHIAKASVMPEGIRPNHVRWHSVDIVHGQPTIHPSPKGLSLTAAMHQRRRSLQVNRSSEQEAAVLRCAPQVVGSVAEVFRKYIPRFSIYSDYGADYEIVARDIEETQRSIATWPDFDRAIEALSSTVNPERSREANRKKALTIKDLLIKPIQRLPRYELLLGDLAKLTPVCDGPETHASLQDLLSQLNAICQDMNAAKDSDPARLRKLETTWLLGDRLMFSDQVPKSIFLQMLGPVELCACLHIAYRSEGEFMKGMYVICVLFDTTLLLATAEEEGARYAVLAGVPLASAAIEESDNRKGLQCYTAPHTWKLVFEHGARVYEIILTACSAVEALVWREQLELRTQAQSLAVAQGKSNVFELHSPLVNDLRSIGKAFGKPGSFIRQASSTKVHRTATVGPMTDLNQVIIKNTLAVKDAQETAASSTTSLQIPRSQSVATPSHVQTLAPRRANRVRLEVLLNDVWSKHLLPYPGMTVRRSEQIRGSANNVIRKFSMASITSNFSSKRSASHTSMSGYPGSLRKEDMPPPHLLSKARPAPKPTRMPLSDLLPADFDLQNERGKKGGVRRGFRALTMTMERPFSPLLAGDGRGSSLRRAKSVRDNVAGVTETCGMAGLAQVPVRAKTPLGVLERMELPALPPDTEEHAVKAQGTEMIKSPKKSKSKRLLQLLRQ